MRFHRDSLSSIPDFKAQGRDPFDQNFRKFRSKTRWIGSVQPEKFRKNGSYLLRWTTFPGRTGRNFGWMDPAPGFQIPQRKIFRIPGSTSKNFPDSGIRIPLHGAIKSGMQSLNHNVVKVFRYSFSVTIPTFFNRLKGDFILVWSPWNFNHCRDTGLAFVNYSFKWATINKKNWKR